MPDNETDEKPDKNPERDEHACPFCSRAMHNHKLGEVEIEHCVSCGSLWFERGELRRIAASTTGKDLLTDRRLWEDAERFKGDLSEALCPACRIQLVELRHDADSPTIKMCPRCHGVLLEKGELKALIRSLSEEGPMETIEEVLDGETSIPRAAERLEEHFSNALLRLAVEIEASHPYLSGIIKGFEQAIS